MFLSDALVIARARQGKTTAYFFRLCLLLTAIHLAGVLIPMALAQAEDSGKVSLALMKPSGQVYSRVEPSLQLTTTKATKQPGDHLATLLRRRGFHFDGSSASLFYRANPGVTDFANLPASAEVNAPDIEKTPAVQRALKSGFVVYVTTDKELKENVSSAVNQLIAAEPIFDQLDAQVFASPEERRTAIDELSRATRYLRDVRTLIQDDVQPFDTETLEQYRGDAELLLSIVRDSASSGHLPPAAKDKISLVARDVSVKARGLNGSKSPGEVSRYPQRTMVVTVKPKNDPRIETEKVYVCYAPVALMDLEDYHHCWGDTGPVVQVTASLTEYFLWLAVNKTSPHLSGDADAPLENGAITLWFSGNRK